MGNNVFGGSRLRGRFPPLQEPPAYPPPTIGLPKVGDDSQTGDMGFPGKVPSTGIISDMIGGGTGLIDGNMYPPRGVPRESRDRELIESPIKREAPGGIAKGIPGGERPIPKTGVISNIVGGGAVPPGIDERSKRIRMF